MIIGIDARMLHEGLGIGRYIEQLLKHLERLDTKNEYYVFLRKKNFDTYQPQNSRFKKICADYHWYSFSEQIFFPLLILRYRIDCMHFPHFNVPILYPRKFIVTVHDLILIKFPLSASSAATSRHTFLHKIKYFAYRCILQIAVHRASRIITISEYVKKDIITYLHVSPGKIHVIYEAANSVRECSSVKHLPASVKKPYILYTGNAYPHKNIEGLLQAFLQLSSDNNPIYLVLCGQEDFFFKRVVLRIRELGLTARVEHLGFVSENTLCWLYRNAVACIIPSFEEGFGLPALEAMIHGTPVIVSNSTCFQEILSDDALYIDPNSPQTMVHTIRALIKDTALQDDLRKRGILRASKYSWVRTAQQTASLYEKNA